MPLVVVWRIAGGAASLGRAGLSEQTVAAQHEVIKALCPGSSECALQTAFLNEAAFLDRTRCAHASRSVSGDGVEPS